jgi:hypothetical protein
MAENLANRDKVLPRPRFSWPMRVFLFLLLFNIAFRSLSVLYPWADWVEPLEMDRMPRRLPTQEEIAELAAKTDTTEGFDPVAEDIFRAFDGLWDFARPWPGRATRAQLHEPSDWGAWSLVWVCSRFAFVESVIGFDQEWAMFSPNVSKRRWLTRARLTYADASEIVVRQTADPEDLTHYSHWFQEKVLDYELHVKDAVGHNSDCNGYCNLLAHRHRANAAGAPLVKISLFEILYRYPSPDDDAIAFLRAQTGPPADQVYPVYFIYDVASREGKRAAKQ